MATYMVSCSCGGQLAVEPGQAGETLRCECGRQVAVPTLRRLRELPRADEARGEASDTAATDSAWGVRQGVITVLVIAAVGSLAAAGVSRWQEPTMPTFNPAGWTELMDTKISELTPEAAWQAWVQFYEPLTQSGFSEMQYHGTEELERQIAWHRGLQITFGAIAAVCIIAAIAVAMIGRSAQS